MSFLQLRSSHKPLQLSLFPTVTTQAVTDITGITATGNGTVINVGGSALTSRGICWSLSPQPTTADFTGTSGGQTGVYTVAMTSLSEGATYYVRAYAINATGTAYGDQVQFMTTAVAPTPDRFWMLPNQPVMTRTYAVPYR
jgi:hypothetical protein